MNGWLVLLAVAATFVATTPAGDPGTTSRRLAAVASRAGPVAHRRSGPAGPAAPGAGARAAAAALVGLGVATLVGAGAVTGPGAAVVTWTVLGRLEPAAVRRRRERVLGQAPAAVDLLVACLDAGATPDAALAAVGGALDGPVGAVLRDAATATSLGASAAEVLRGWEQDPALAPLLPVGAALARSEDDGVPLVRTLRHVADDLRAERSHRVAAAARRAGVRAAAPLGLCFLPAFVLVGLVPVGLALAG